MFATTRRVSALPVIAGAVGGTVDVDDVAVTVPADEIEAEFVDCDVAVGPDGGDPGTRPGDDVMAAAAAVDVVAGPAPDPS